MGTGHAALRHPRHRPRVQWLLLQRQWHLCVNHHLEFGRNPLFADHRLGEKPPKSNSIFLELLPRITYTWHIDIWLLAFSQMECCPTDKCGIGKKVIPNPTSKSQAQLLLCKSCGWLESPLNSHEPTVSLWIMHYFSFSQVSSWWSCSLSCCFSTKVLNILPSQIYTLDIIWCFQSDCQRTMRIRNLVERMCMKHP